MKTKEKECVVLYGLFNSGQITIEEFLTFAPLSFAPELLKMIKERKIKSPLPESCVE